jgi:hypothetical protein
VKPFLQRLAHRIGFALLASAILLIGVWCSIAIWYRCAVGEPVCGLLAGAPLVFALVVVAGLLTPRRWLALTVYSASIALFFGWWATITPTNDRNWAPDVARTVTATIDGRSPCGQQRAQFHLAQRHRFRSAVGAADLQPVAFDQRRSDHVLLGGRGYRPHRAVRARPRSASAGISGR